MGFHSIDDEVYFYDRSCSMSGLAGPNLLQNLQLENLLDLIPRYARRGHSNSHRIIVYILKPFF